MQPINWKHAIVAGIIGTVLFDVFYKDLFPVIENKASIT